MSEQMEQRQHAAFIPPRCLGGGAWDSGEVTRLVWMWVWSAQSHVFRGALVEHVTIKGSTYKSKTR